MKFWLLKTEPCEYSIEMLQAEGIGHWDGIRNYQARNFIRDMQDGDSAFLYHSSCKAPGIYGTMQIVGCAYPDNKALDIKSKYFDKKASLESNPWSGIDVQFQSQLSTPLLLPDIKALDLGACPLTARGNRLSVIPLTQEQFEMLSSEIAKTNST